MIQAVLFDLDGTLTNTIDDIATAMNRALRLHGLMRSAVLSRHGCSKISVVVE